MDDCKFSRIDGLFQITPKLEFLPHSLQQGLLHATRPSNLCVQSKNSKNKTHIIHSQSNADRISFQWLTVPTRNHGFCDRSLDIGVLVLKKKTTTKQRKFRNQPLPSDLQVCSCNCQDCPQSWNFGRQRNCNMIVWIVPKLAQSNAWKNKTLQISRKVPRLILLYKVKYPGLSKAKERKKKWKVCTTPEINL